MKSVNMTLIVKGMTCGGCERAVERALSRIDGVISARASVQDEQVAVTYDADRTDAEKLRQAVAEAGYTPG
jgi:copper chaperone CopZ